jgi:hypothetical protein
VASVRKRKPKEKKMKKIITIISMIVFAQASAKAVVCTPSAYTAPTSCTGYTAAYAEAAGNTVPMTGSWMVWGCTGGSGVKRFAGISYCSSTNDGKSNAQQGNPGNSPGKYCWCALTNPAASAWVFGNDHGSSDNCSRYCALDCAYYARNYSDFRSALFEAIGD